MKKNILVGLAIAIVFIILFRYFLGGNELLVGDIAPEIEFKDLAGRKIGLSEFKDRFVILDFWGSWCIPCRASNRKLVAFYENQDTSRIKVISVGIEKDKREWKKAINDDSLFWDEQFTPLGMFDNEITEIYDINLTPTYFLINPQQSIVEKSGNIDHIIRKYDQYTRNVLVNPEK